MWAEHGRSPFPASDRTSLEAAELALYESWLMSIVEATLAQGELLSGHAAMLEQRRQEGNQQLWKAAGGSSEPYRSYLARLLAIEDLLAHLIVP